MSTIKDAINDLFDHRLPLHEAVDRHFAPSFRQRTNGQWDDRAAFVERVSALRQVVERATTTVLEELEAGDRYAERHVVQLIQHDGERIAQEVYLFATRDADGRFNRIEEATLKLAV